MKFKCKNCDNYCIFPEKYKNGKNLKKKEFIQIDVSCEFCESIHTISMKFMQGNKHNILGYVVNFQYTEKLQISNAFWFEETKNNFTLNGYITNCYLLLGFDEEKNLKNRIDSIQNTADKSIMKSCLNIIKITRNKITQHNKKKETLSSLKEDEIYSLFIASINTMVNIFKKNNYLPYDIKDRRIRSREIIFE